VRPGPIQGDMVHPYLRRRNGEEAVSYPSDAVKSVLQRTLGVPIFQEQVMQLAIVAAGFSPGEADQLRRAMAAWKRHGGLGHFGERLIRGMRERGYSEAFAQRIFEQIKGFGEYGFPESHAASFALLVYVSAWLKCHEPAAFTAALLNSQPMGFYGPSQLVRDARAHGVTVRAVDVLCSAYDCTLEPDGTSARPVLRLGLRLVRGFGAAAAERLVQARAVRPFGSLQDLAVRAELDRGQLEALAAAGACATLTGNRHQAFWAVAGMEAELPLAPAAEEIAVPMLAQPTEGEDLVADYRHLGLTLGRHPLALLRTFFEPRRVLRASDLLMQLQADLAGVPVARPHMLESTAYGAALLARVGVSRPDAPRAADPADDAVPAQLSIERRFEPVAAPDARCAARLRWSAAVAAVRAFAHPGSSHATDDAIPQASAQASAQARTLTPTHATDRDTEP